MVSIVQKDSKGLRAVATPVLKKQFGTPELKKIVSDMKKALSSQKDGVAIAAPQIAVPLRIFVVSGRVFAMNEFLKKKKSGNKAHEPEAPPKKFPDRVFINPELLKASKQKEWMEEGCLSVRYLYGHVERSKKVRIKAYDEKGELFELGGSGLLSQVFQHELDHLEGVLFLDKAKDVVELTQEEYEQEQA